MIIWGLASTISELSVDYDLARPNSGPLGELDSFLLCLSAIPQDNCVSDLSLVGALIRQTGLGQPYYAQTE